MEVREVLDLRKGHEARYRAPEGEPEDRRLVEDGVEHARRPEARLEAARHAVDPTLDGDVLAEQQRLRVAIEDLAEPRVDRLRERQALCRRLTTSDQRRNLARIPRRKWTHHVLGRRELLSLHRLDRTLANLRADLEVLVGEVLPAPRSGPGEPRPEREQRVPLEFGADLLPRSVRRLEVGAGVTQEPDRPQMEHRRMPVVANPRRELLCRRERRRGLVSVRALDGELRTTVERLLDPRLRRRNADPQPVVLADEEQWQRLAAVGEVCGSVEGSLCRRVVERGVAERADDDRVERPRALDAQLARALDRERDPDRTRQVRRDRRRLWEDGEVAMAEHLVPAAGDRLLGGGGHAEEDVPDAVAARLLGAREVEAARAVVEERGVAGTQRERDEGVRLVAGGADRVEAELLRLQPARGVVDGTALDPRAPGNRCFRRRRARRPRLAEARAARRGGGARADRDRRPRPRTLPSQPAV